MSERNKKGVPKQRVSPRQKMINLMYVVLMAMLALNVSSDVLNGFSLVEDSLNRTTANASEANQAIYKNFEEQMKNNPSKVKAWYDKAQLVKRMSDSLYNYAEELKVRIVRQADGKEGDVRRIRNKEDLEAASTVMLAPRRGEGEHLYKSINQFREQIIGMLVDETQKKIIASNLSTDVPDESKVLGKGWPEYMFENMPVAAAVTLLSKLQSDVRYAESEVLHTLVANIDIKDIRVNQLNAYVIPNSRTIVQGGKLSAQIIMAAVDTTNVSYQWYQMDSSIDTDQGGGVGWKKLANASGQFSGVTTSTLTIYAGQVDSSAVFKCVAKDTDSASATYNQTFADTASFVDLSDPIQVIIESTGGDRFKNGEGSTVLTARVYQAGEEIDTAGEGTYTWSKYDKNGQKVASFSKTGKTLSVGSADVDIKGTFVCVVEI